MSSTTLNRESKYFKKFASTETQTVIRDNETQTHPWTPGYVVKRGEPEVLLLDSFEWEKNLPAGRHEVDVIERMRMKRAWENYLSYIYTDENAKFRSRVVTEIEMSEALFREKEIKIQNSIRMELMQGVIEEFQSVMGDKYIRKVKAQLEKNKNRLDNVAKRIYCQRARACLTKSHDHELKCPQNKTEVKKHNCQHKLMAVNEEEFLASRPPAKLPRSKRFKSLSDEVPMFKNPRDEDTIDIEPEREFLERLYQSAILLQRLIRGRAVQVLMHLGLEKNRDLIDELKGTFGFTPADEDEVSKERILKLQAFREYHYLLKKYGMVAIVNDKLAGATINGMADFANKELMRIKDERRAYAMVQLAEKARWKREAAESGRRQKELRRRRQHDEVFRRVMRRNEITTDFYLKLLMESAIKNVSREQAHASTMVHAEEVDLKDQEDAEKEFSVIEREEIAAQIIHSFLLPETDKNIARKRIEMHQKKSREYARKILYATKPLTGGKFTRETDLLEENLSSSSSYGEAKSMPKYGFELDEQHELSRPKESTVEKETSDISLDRSASVIEPLPEHLRPTIRQMVKKQYHDDDLSIGSLGSLIPTTTEQEGLMQMDDLLEPSGDPTASDSHATLPVESAVSAMALPKELEVEQSFPSCSGLPPINIETLPDEETEDIEEKFREEGLEKLAKYYKSIPQPHNLLI